MKFIPLFLNWQYAFMNCCAELTPNVHVVCEDGNATKVLQKNSPFHFTSRGYPSKSEALDFGDRDYRQLVTKRPLHILSYVIRGINVLYTDIDTVFLKNPFEWFADDEVLAPIDMKSWRGWVPYYCTGILGLRSSAHTISLLQQWHNLTLRSEYAHFMNQPLFNIAVRTSRVAVRALDQDHFPPGRALKGTTLNRTTAVIAHANFVKGLHSKIALLKYSGAWFIT